MQEYFDDEWGSGGEETRTLVGINEDEGSFAYLVHRHAEAVRKTCRQDGICLFLG